MKHTLIAAAIGAAFAAAAPSSFALTAAATGALPAASVIRASGATAQDPGILATMRRSCAGGSLDTFAFTGTNAQTVYSCTTSVAMSDGTNTIPSGTSIALIKDSAAGSANGITPYTAGGAGIRFVTLSSLAGSCTTVAAVAASGSLIAYNSYSCGSTPSLAAAATPDIGFSDVEPKVFGFANVPNATISAANQLLFGVPVSIALYNALQAAQGLTVTTTADTANRPSLTASQVAGLYGGFLMQASDLGITPSLSDTQVYVARRADTSGSQKAAEIFFLNGNIIAPPPVPFSFADSGGATSTVTSNANYAILTAGCGIGATPPSAGRVFAGNGSGDVRNCLNFHGANRYAVGVLSMESNENAIGSNWRWVKVNGVMPTNANAIRGTYEYWTEQALLLANAATPYGRGFYGYIKQELGNPAQIPALNGGFTVFASEPAGEQATGIVGLPNAITGLNGGACSGRFTTSTTSTPDNNPINISTRSASGSPDSGVKPGVAVCPPRFPRI
jgi:ABC-type phosphate transport system substrate-binding protein